jgi:hypothetical protein
VVDAEFIILTSDARDLKGAKLKEWEKIVKQFDDLAKANGFIVMSQNPGAMLGVETTPGRLNVVIDIRNATGLRMFIKLLERGNHGTEKPKIGIKEGLENLHAIIGDSLAGKEWDSTNREWIEKGKS